MKPFRFLLKNCALALLCFTTFSCIDNSYNLTDLSGKAELFKNSLSAPAGTIKINLDSVIGGLDVDTSTLKVQNGTYVFGYSGAFEFGGISEALNDFNLAPLNGFSTSVPLFDASVLPPNTPLPFDLVPMSYEYSTPINIDLPNFTTDLISVDSISLQTTTIKISVSEEGLGGNNLENSISITFATLGTGADYYINGEKVTSWTVKMNQSVTVEIRKLRLSGDNNKLELDPLVVLNVAELGDVQATELIQTKMNVNIEYPNGLDYDVVWGQVHYNLPKNQISPIHFDGLGKIMSENDTLSIYNPKLILTTKGNIGVPIDLTLDMKTTNSTTGNSSPGLTDPTIHMLAASDTSDFTPHTYTLQRENGTAELFKINPDIIQLSYSAQTVNKEGESYFISKKSQLSMSYRMEIPLQFGSDLKISVDTTLENPFKDKLDKLENQTNLSASILLNIQNRIPLNMQIILKALDANDQLLFTVQTDRINASAVNEAGLATDFTETDTEITLTPAQINKLKDTKMFSVSFVVTAKQGVESVTVQPSDYITIKIGGKLSGGVLLDFKSK